MTFRAHRHGWAWMGILGRLGLLLILAALFIFLIGSDLWHHHVSMRGIEDGLAMGPAPSEQSRLGVNVALERYPDEGALRQALRSMKQAGLGTIRQRFAWQELEPSPGDYHWERWDWILPIVHEEQFTMIAVIDTSPAWARQTWEADQVYAPPRDALDYANWVRALAGRYGPWISAYQIWDEPNIAPHWGSGPIDPAAYVTLLSAASPAIREGDPDAVIIGGGMAPNLEAGGRNMSDVQFLHEIYRLGAGQWFDVLGVKAYGFWSGAYDRRVDENVLNYSRVILLREEMLRRGDADKPVWAMEGGWCALPEDWRGQSSPQGSDTAAVQADRLEHALQRMQKEWPWMGLFLVGHWQPLTSEDDPLWGYAMLNPQGRTNLSLVRLERWSQQNDVLYPGFTGAGQISDSTSTSVPVSLRFWGTDVNLLFSEPLTDQSWVVTLDGQDIATRHEEPPQVWRGESSRWWRVRLARGLEPQVHGLQIGATSAQLAALEGIQVGHRPPLRDLWLTLLAGTLVLTWIGVAIYRTVRVVSWREAWFRICRWWGAMPSSVQIGSVVAPFVVLMAWPSPLVRSGCLLVYGLASLLRPDVAMAVAVAAIPTAPLLVRLPKGAFSLTEISVVVAVAGRLWKMLLSPSHERSAKGRWSVLDIAVAALVLWSLGSSFLAEYRRVAFREWRTVVFESAVLYWLLRTFDERTWRRERFVDVLWFSAVALAVYALLVYPLPSGVIEAEGVRRARAFYGSPNNLALYLDRLLPLGLAMAAWGQTLWRRWSYGVGSILVALVILLTFSRGAWFLGVPAGLLVLVWGRGGSKRWVALGSVIVGLVVLATLAGAERITSLLDFTSGTTFLRINLWRASWDMLMDHFWLGVGLDNFLYYYGDYIRSGAEVDRWLSHPHNIVLDFWLRLGVGGIVLLLVFVTGFFRSARRALRANATHDMGRDLRKSRVQECHPAPDAAPAPWGTTHARGAHADEHAMLLGIVAGLVAVLAHGMIDSAFFLAELAFWFMFALAWVQRRGGEANAG